jgi:hypothetical protein
MHKSRQWSLSAVGKFGELLGGIMLNCVAVKVLHTVSRTVKNSLPSEMDQYVFIESYNIHVWRPH